jgi:nucleotide-binding universal stress UspA family protein
MTKDEGQGATRRILVAMDAFDPSRALIDATVRLAVARHAELVGLFVEDEDVVEAAALPFSRAVGPASAALPVGGGVMEQALRAHASRLRGELGRVAERWGVPWAFRVVRGAITERLLEEARGYELVALGRTSQARSQAAPLGHTARRTVVGASCSVLLLPPSPRRSGRVVTVFEGSEGTLQAGLEVARAEGAPLEVVAVADETDKASQLQQAARQWAARRGVRLSVRPLVVRGAEDLAGELHTVELQSLVLDAGGMLARGKLDAALEQIESPALLVR